MVQNNGFKNRNRRMEKNIINKKNIILFTVKVMLPTILLLIVGKNNNIKAKQKHNICDELSRKVSMTYSSRLI